MTKREKQAVINAPLVGYYSGFGGIEVKKIQYGIEDYCVFVAGAWYGTKTAHRVKIHYETDRPYFIFHGYRVYFDEILRY